MKTEKNQELFEMQKAIFCLKMAILFVIVIPCVHAQESTEQFIPIGKSPGLSGKQTILGNIDSVFTAERAVNIQDSTGKRYSVRITDSTRVYRDLSELKMSNKRGSFADCKPGVYAEVYFKTSAHQGVLLAEWIKLRVTEVTTGKP